MEKVSIVIKTQKKGSEIKGKKVGLHDEIAWEVTSDGSWTAAALIKNDERVI